MNAVIYARYSSDNQREESIDGQIRECKEYAARMGLTIIECYIDRAQTGMTDDRPEFQRMIRDSAKGQFESVLVWKLDRFARDRYDSVHYKRWLRKNGVNVISAVEPIPEGPEGILLESLLEGHAEYFSKELSRKVTRGMKENALTCRHNGGVPAFGFTVDKTLHYHADPVIAPIVLDIFEKYDQGISMKEIAEELNRRGVRSARGNSFNIARIAQILGNRKYIGEYRFGDTVVPDGIPALVPKDLFDRVQARKGKNQHAPARAKATENYLLTTKLCCGKCGAFMVGESGTSSTGMIYRYYRCVNTKRHKTCDKKAVKKDWIEDIVLKATMQLIQNEKLLERLAHQLYLMQEQESHAAALLKSELKEIEKRLHNLMDAIEQGIITPTTKERLQELEQEKARLEEHIAVEEIHHTVLSEEQILFFLFQFQKTDITDENQKQHLIDCFVNQIFLYDDHLVLTFNYKDGTKTISLADVESSDLYIDAVPEKAVILKRITAFSFSYLQNPSNHLPSTRAGKKSELFQPEKARLIFCLGFFIKQHQCSTWNQPRPISAPPFNSPVKPLAISPGI